MLINEKPFTRTGIDFSGPIQVKTSRGTRSNPAKAKCSGVIFTCMAVRAIHLELVSDLSTGAFIMGLRRFHSRLGQVRIIRSDYGTNFVGAVTEMKEFIKKIDHSKVVKYFSEKQIDFQCIFNPPSSPWMGGAWESLTKTLKRLLKAITSDRIFTEEALYTFLCETEFIVNQQPSTAISEDIRDYDVLSPNHFIIGETNANLTSGQFDNSQINYRKKWKNGQAATNTLRNRWRKEYLPTLTQRKKGLVHNRIFKIGDFIIINESNVPRSYWPLGRIIETPPG